MLLRLIEEHKPTHMIVAFDAGKVTFRHEGYQDYKGGLRKNTARALRAVPIAEGIAD